MGGVVEAVTRRWREAERWWHVKAMMKRSGGGDDGSDEVAVMTYAVW